MKLQLRAPSLLIAGGLFVVSLALYISTLAPSVVTIFDDSLEFQLVTYQLGIAHPTGYPLYTLLGKLFTLMPVGNVAYRVNLMSAVFGAAAVTLLYLLILQVALPKKALHPAAPDSRPLPGWPLHAGGLVGALLLAAGRVFWQQATVAEVYTLNAFFVVLLLLVTTNTSGHSAKGLLWLAFLAGLSLTHHRTMLLLFPVVGLYLLVTPARRHLFNRNTLPVAGLLFLLPLLLYLYLPLRGHVGSLDETYQNTWAGFWQQVSASGYGTFIFDNPFGHNRTALFYWNLLADQVYTTVPGLIGLAYLLRFGQPKMLALTGLAFLTYLAFNLFYNVTDIEVFFIPNFIIWAVWSGAGTAFLLYAAAGIKVAVPRPKSPPPEHVDTRPAEQPTPIDSDSPAPENSTNAPSKFKRWQPVVVLAALGIFVLILYQVGQTNFSAMRQHYTWQVHDYGLDILQQPLPEESAIVGILGEMTLVRYFQQTENMRPDVETVTANLESERLAAVEQLLAAGKSVYLTRELPGAAARWSLSAVGPLIRVNPKPVTAPPEFSVAVGRAVTPDVTLLGYTRSRPPHTGAGPAPVRLTLIWQVNQTPAADLKVSARLLTPAGEVLAATDGGPVHFAYPTTAWRSGEVISDVYDVALPVDTPPGQYTPLIIWYAPAQNGAEVGRIELQPLVIE